jgi:hypothetical protein
MRRLMLVLAAAVAAFAQSQPNVVTITASRQLNVQPDQVMVSITVVTDPDQTIDAALAALQGTNITAADLSSVSTTYGAGSTPQLQWTFNLTVSISDMTSLVAAVNPSGNVSVFVSGASASAAVSAAQQCPYPALINDARAQAAKLASAAGVTVGQIVSISQGTIPVDIPTLASRVGDFQFVSGVLGFTSFLLTTPQPATSGPTTCAVTVQFQLGQ